MPYHISWNLRTGTAGLCKPWGRARIPCPYAILSSCIAQDKSQNQSPWFWRGLVIPVQGSMIGKQKHYQNLQHCELLSMNHENQSGEREKQENCLFLLIWAETNSPSNTNVYRSQTWPTLTKLVTLCLSKNLPETGLQLFSFLPTTVRSEAISSNKSSCINKLNNTGLLLPWPLKILGRCPGYAS